jgi:Ca2+-binding EF-hand superfamily protein
MPMQKRAAGFAVFTAVAGASVPCFAQSKSDAASIARALYTRADENADKNVTYWELSKVVHDSVTRQIHKRFTQLDRNKDGRCTRAEVNKMDKARFLRFDLNRDGHFTQAELATVMRQDVNLRLRRVYAALDLDRNGHITLAELAPASEPATVVVAKDETAETAKPVDVATRGGTPDKL